MRKTTIRTGFAAALILLAGCNKPAADADSAPAADSSTEGETIADALAGASSETKFLAAAKATGLDKTFAGPGPYTVLVPSDAAFDKLPAGALDALLEPGSRAQLTGVLTYHVLPGTILAADIGKAIDNGKGKAVLATMGGATLNAVREDGKIVLSDSVGTRAVVTGADGQRSNGVVHQIDSVLMPS